MHPIVQASIAKQHCLYNRFVKRLLDVVIAGLALVILSPVLAVVALLIKIKLGSPVIFAQKRPGLIDERTGVESIFKLYKFRTMTDERGVDGELLPDEKRLTHFGKLLRSTSIDELPELLNIIKGDMSIIGPRPQLIKDLVFMSDKQRMRHLVKPGLSGLAQVSGRNSISWDAKLELDLEYLNHLSFILDLKIVLLTFKKVLIREGINADGMETSSDFGDYLLANERITEMEYRGKMIEAEDLLNG